MIDYGKEYNGHQVAKKIRTEDAGGGRADKVGSLTQESERGSGGRTSNLFSAEFIFGYFTLCNWMTTYCGWPKKTSWGKLCRI